MALTVDTTIACARAGAWGVHEGRSEAFVCTETNQQLIIFNETTKSRSVTLATGMGSTIIPMVDETNDLVWVLDVNGAVRGYDLSDGTWGTIVTLFSASADGRRVGTYGDNAYFCGITGQLVKTSREKTPSISGTLQIGTVGGYGCVADDFAYIAPHETATVIKVHLPSFTISATYTGIGGKNIDVRWDNVLGRLYVSDHQNGSTDARIIVINTSGTILGTIVVGGWPHTFGLDSGSESLAVGAASPKIAAANTNNYGIGTTILPGTGTVFHCTVDSTLGYVWVSEGSSGADARKVVLLTGLDSGC